MTPLASLTASADREILTEILREAESYLGAQLTASIAADQRAIAFSGLLAAASVVVAGAAGTLFLTAPPRSELGWICIGLTATFLISMFFANLSAMPARFWFVGNTPKQWEQDLKDHTPITNSLAQQIQHYEDMIAANNQLMRRNSKQMLAAIWFSWSGLVIWGTGGIYLLARG